MAELQKTKRFLNKIKDPEDRRKERNRLSAKRARDKKSQLIVSLMQENAELKRRVAALESGKSVQEATDPSCFGYV